MRAEPWAVLRSVGMFFVFFFRTFLLQELGLGLLYWAVSRLLV